MTKYKKFFLSFAIIVLIGYIVYILFMYTKNNFSSVLFYSYLTLGILINGGGVIALAINFFREKSILNDNISNTYKILNPQKLLYNVRIYLSSLLGLVYSIPPWVAIILKSFIDSIQNRNKPNIQSTRNDLYAISLMVFDTWYSIYLFISIFILLMLSNDYTNISIQIIFISIVLRHLNYIVEIDILPRRLRRNLVNPYIHYMIILIFDFLTLLISTVYFQNNTILVDYNLYYDSLVQLFGYKDLFKQINYIKFSFNDYLIIVAGFMFSMSLVKMLFSFKKFQKIDEDYTWLAHQQATIGKYSKALETINNVKGFTERDYMIKIVIFLGTNNLTEAISLAKDYNKIFHKIKRSKINDIFRTLMDGAMSIDMEKSVQSKIINYGIDNNIDDYLLCDMTLAAILSFNDLEKNSIINIIINKKHEYKITYAYLMFEIENNYNESIHFASQKGNILLFLNQQKTIDRKIEYIMLSNLEFIIMSEEKYYNFSEFNALKKEYFENLKQFKVNKYSLLELIIVSFNMSKLFVLSNIETVYKEQMLLLFKDMSKYIKQSEIKNNFYAKKIEYLINTIDPS